MSDIDGTGPGTGGEHAGRVPAAPASPSRPGRLGVGIISAGRVGAVLGCALRAVEHQVVGVHAVSEESRERAEMLLLFAPGAPRESYFGANVARAAAGLELSEEERLAFLRAHDQYDA